MFTLIALSWECSHLRRHYIAYAAHAELLYWALKRSLCGTDALDALMTLNIMSYIQSRATPSIPKRKHQHWGQYIINLEQYTSAQMCIQINILSVGCCSPCKTVSKTAYRGFRNVLHIVAKSSRSNFDLTWRQAL